MYFGSPVAPLVVGNMQGAAAVGTAFSPAMIRLT
jgi:hypothetical protein